MVNALTIAIVGRPNVGKSTLFNRLLGKKKSLVHDLPGVTRDRVEALVDWTSHGFPIQVRLLDTGGLTDVGAFTTEIEQSIDAAVTESDIVFWVVDGDTGVLPEDQQFGRWLRKRLKQPLVLIVNKVDDAKHEDRVHDFYSLGCEEIFTISAEHQRGIDELRRRVLDLHAARSETAAPNAMPSVDCKLAIVGRPNVGKSTLTNALLGKHRMIVSDIAGTTIDSVDATLRMGDRTFQIVDTAGIRRKSKTEKDVEVLSVVKALQAVEAADVVLLVLDGEHGIVDQDEKIAGLIEKAGKGVILVVNKWDLMRRTGFTKEMAAENIRAQMRFLYYAPIVFLSAKEARGLEDLGDLAVDILTQRQAKVATQELTAWIKTEAEIHNPKQAKFYLSHQASKHPPTFVCHVNDPKKIDFSLKRHLIKGIRAKWGFMGNPVRMVFTKSRNKRAFTT